MNTCTSTHENTFIQESDKCTCTPTNVGRVEMTNKVLVDGCEELITGSEIGRGNCLCTDFGTS